LRCPQFFKGQLPFLFSCGAEGMGAAKRDHQGEARQKKQPAFPLVFMRREAPLSEFF